MLKTHIYQYIVNMSNDNQLNCNSDTGRNFFILKIISYLLRLDFADGFVEVAVLVVLTEFDSEVSGVGHRYHRSVRSILSNGELLGDQGGELFLDVGFRFRRRVDNESEVDVEVLAFFQRFERSWR